MNHLLLNEATKYSFSTKLLLLAMHVTKSYFYTFKQVFFQI